MKILNSDQNLEYWNNIGSEKVFNNPNLFLSELDFLPKDSSILDIGCGYGRTLKELEEQGYNNLHGIDYSEVMIAKAREKLTTNTSLENCRANNLPYHDYTFDVVFLLAVLNCIPNPREELDVINEALRVLKRGGYLLVNDFVMAKTHSKHNIESDAYGDYIQVIIDQKCRMRHTTPDRIREMISSVDVFFESLCSETSMNGNPIVISSQIFKLK